MLDNANNAMIAFVSVIGWINFDALRWREADQDALSNRIET